MSGIRPLDCSKLVRNPKNYNDVTIWNMTSMSNCFDVVLFLLSSLVTGRSSMSTSSLVLELWQFCFIRDWPEIRKSEIHPSEFCLISGDWGELWVPNLAQMSLIGCYWMVQNSNITAFTVLESLRKNHSRGITPPPPPPSQPRLGLSAHSNKRIQFNQRTPNTEDKKSIINPAKS